MDSFTISKGIIFILARGILLGGAVFGAVTLGGVVYAIENVGSPGLAPIFGLASGVTFYLAGLAGREHATPFLKRHLLPPPPEPTK